MDGGGDGVTEPMVTWLHGVLDETEQRAKALPQASWELYLGDLHYVNSEGAPVATCGDTHAPDAALHIAAHDPRSVLARVEAERAILNAAVLAREIAQGDRDLMNDADQWESALGWLAYGHRHDMEGYDPAWAPVGVTVDE